MENMLRIIGSGAWHVACHVATILPMGTLLGAGVALRLPRHIHLDVVILLLLTVSGITSILAHASAFQEARLGRVAIVVALGCIISRSHCLNESLTLMDELVTGLRDYAFIMAVVTSVVAMTMQGAARRRHQSDGIAEEENLPSPSPKPRNTLCKPSAKRSWDLASSTSHLDFLSDNGSLDFKHMSGPKSNHSGHSFSEESVLSLSSGLKRDPGWITDIVQWAATATPAAFGKRDSTSIETVSEQDSA